MNDNELYSIPLDITDIITICESYNKLGNNIQYQLQSILDLGINESIKSGFVKRESLPFIKLFLETLQRNPYFGDSADQAKEFLFLIKEFEHNNPLKFNLTLN